jgi:hypothetical protein
MATSVPPEASRNELPLAGEPPAGHLTVHTEEYAEWSIRTPTAPLLP